MSLTHFTDCCILIRSGVLHGNGYCGSLVVTAVITVVMGRNWPQTWYYHSSGYLSSGNSGNTFVSITLLTFWLNIEANA